MSAGDGGFDNRATDKLCAAENKNIHEDSFVFGKRDFIFSARLK